MKKGILNILPLTKNIDTLSTKITITNLVFIKSFLETNNNNPQNNCVYGGKGTTRCVCIGTIFTDCKCCDFNLGATFECNGCRAYPTSLFFGLTIVLPINCMIFICYYYVYRHRHYGENIVVDDENNTINGSTKLKKIYSQNN